MLLFVAFLVRLEQVMQHRMEPSTREPARCEVRVHPQTVGYLERGEYSPSLALALRIARFFEVPVEAVFSLDPLPHLSHEIYGRTP